MELRGANVLLTGAGGGLGPYIARPLVAEGANLVLSDLSPEGLTSLRGELAQSGAQAELVAADLTDPGSPAELVSHATELVGPIDILVNNAGLEFAGPLTGATAEELEALIRVNLLAAMELTRLLMPGMVNRGRGQIVSLASLAGRVPAPNFASYTASKHGLVGFTHSLRAEMPRGPVGFSVICPGFVAERGMYGRLQDQVPKPITGTVNPERVGDAVVRAIRRDIPEQILNGRPVKPLALLAPLAPGLTARFSGRTLGGFTRAVAKARGRL